MKKIILKNLRSKIKRWLRLFILLVIVGIFGYDDVFADDNINVNSIDDVYVIVRDNNNSKLYSFNMYNWDDKVFYNIYLDDVVDDFAIADLSDEEVDYVKGVSYFGYGYLEHDSFYYYMAAQEIIWGYLFDVEIDWVKEFNVDGEIIDISSYKEEIFNLIDWYNLSLDLDWDEKSVVRVGDRIILKDNNDIISNYEVVHTNYSNAYIDGDELIIDVGNVMGKEVIELKKIDYYGYDSSFYNDDSLMLVSSGNYKEVVDYVRFNIEGISLKGVVVDSSTNKNFPKGEGSFEGALYSLYDKDDNLVGSYTTDGSGKFYVSDLVMGTYYIEQNKASLGYKLNKNRVKIELNKNNMEVKLRQEIISNKFILKKFYGSNGEYKAERSVMFVIYDNEGKSYSYITTDRFGEAMFSLPYGTFRVEQFTTTDGYFKVNDFYITVKETTDEVVRYNLYDELVRVRLKIVSLYEDGNRNIGCGFTYRLKRKKENTYIEFDGNSVFSSDSEGTVLIPGFLEFGEYVLEQVSVPLGVILNNGLIEFSVDDESNVEIVDNNYFMEVNINNDLVMGRVKINTLEEVNNEYGYNVIASSNTNIKLSALDDIVVNGKVVYKSGQVVFEGITDDNGNLVFDNLYLGNYCVVDVDNNIKKCFGLNSVSHNDNIIEEEIEILKSANKMVNDNYSDKIIEVPSTLMEDIGFYKGIMVLFIVGAGMFVYKKIFISSI